MRSKGFKRVQMGSKGLKWAQMRLKGLNWKNFVKSLISMEFLDFVHTVPLIGVFLVDSLFSHCADF